MGIIRTYALQIVVAAVPIYREFIGCIGAGMPLPLALNPAAPKDRDASISG